MTFHKIQSITMKVLVVALLACLVVACTAAKYSSNTPALFEDKDYLYKQKAIFDLFQHVNQPYVYNELFAEYKDWSIFDYPDKFTNKEAFNYFYTFYKFGFLPQNEIFTVYSEPQRKQVTALFKMFYYAADWDTFYRTAVWSRFHINQGMFVYAFSAALMHREDMRGFILPALYEIEPYFFFNEVVISKAHTSKMQGFYGFEEKPDFFYASIYTNYTDSFFEYSDYQKTAYFTEDLGWNMYYYYFNLVRNLHVTFQSLQFTHLAF
jgi:Hemocyanin, all-alpha domain/Hemocyanin, copper containing domain